MKSTNIKSRSVYSAAGTHFKSLMRRRDTDKALDHRPPHLPAIKQSEFPGSGVLEKHQGLLEVPRRAKASTIIK